MLRDSGFLTEARNITAALYSGSAAAVEEARNNFVNAEQQLAKQVSDSPGGIHSHLYMGFRQLAERYQNYDRRDVDGWLNAMDEDIARHEERYRIMRRAALTESATKAVVKQLHGAGLARIAISPFTLSGQSLPVAWSISAERKQ